MQELLQDFDTQMAEQGNTNFLTYNIYLTRGWDKDQVIYVLHTLSVYQLDLPLPLLYMYSTL
jgi:hypothetical protein